MLVHPNFDVNLPNCFTKLILWYLMKRLFVLIAAMLCSFQAFSQEAEDGNTFLFIPRVDVNPYIPFNSGGYSGFDLSNTSLYTLFEGGIGNSDFSYSVEGHWLSSSPSDLYSNTFHSDEVNWLDWANITYAPSNLYFTLGKDILSLGSFEEDEYDFDQHVNLCSTMWNNLQVYQWGAKLGWCNDDETTDLSFQISSSPYGERPFEAGVSGGRLLSYSLMHRGEYGNFTNLTSVNALGYDTNSYVGVFATGNKYSFGDVELGLDLAFRGYDFEMLEKSAVAWLGWTPSDNLSVTFKGGIEALDGLEDVFGWVPNITDGETPDDYYVPASLALATLDGNYCFGGVNVTYNPLENLRLHTSIAANNWAKSVSVNFGVTYFFDVRSLFR